MSKSKVVHAAIYCRVSTQDQDCTRQVRDLKEFADRAGYIVPLSYVYKEKASGMDAKRMDRAQVMQLARERKIQAVLVTELSRWGRSLVDLLDTLNELSSYGVSVIAQNGLQFDLATPQGKLLAGVFGSLAEFERDLLKERIKSGLATARARGKKIGRQPGQVVRPHPLTKQILQMHKNEVSVRRIADQLGISPTTVQKTITKSRI